MLRGLSLSNSDKRFIGVVHASLEERKLDKFEKTCKNKLVENIFYNRELSTFYIYKKFKIRFERHLVTCKPWFFFFRVHTVGDGGNMCPEITLIYYLY